MFLSFDNAKVQQFFEAVKFLTNFNKYILLSLNVEKMPRISLKCVEAYSYPRMRRNALEMAKNSLKLDFWMETENHWKMKKDSQPIDYPFSSAAYFSATAFLISLTMSLSKSFV